MSEEQSLAKQNLGVAQVVERYLGVVEAVGSSPATQTKAREYRKNRYSSLFMRDLKPKRASNVKKNSLLRLFFSEKVRNGYRKAVVEQCRREAYGSRHSDQSKRVSEKPVLFFVYAGLEA